MRKLKVNLQINKARNLFQKLGLSSGAEKAPFPLPNLYVGLHLRSRGGGGVEVISYDLHCIKGKYYCGICPLGLGRHQ